MKKSWKSAVNFDAEIPKFTPFDNAEDLPQGDANLNEVLVQKVPSEVISSKISSKIRSPPKHVAQIYSQFHQEMTKNSDSINDFGAFDANVANEEPIKADEVKQETVEQVISEVAHEQVDISQILNDLTEEADKNQNNNNSVETDDELDIESISSNSNSTKYKVGQILNVTIDTDDSLVNVNLDQNTLKEIFTGSRSHSNYQHPDRKPTVK